MGQEPAADPHGGWDVQTMSGWHLQSIIQSYPSAFGDVRGLRKGPGHEAAGGGVRRGQRAGDHIVDDLWGADFSWAFPGGGRSREGGSVRLQEGEAPALEVPRDLWGVDTLRSGEAREQMTTKKRRKKLVKGFKKINKGSKERT